MYALFVTIFVKPNFIDEFMEITTIYANDVRNEKGNKSFEFYKSEDNSAIFYIFEDYKTKDDFITHRNSVHSINWKQDIIEMMEKPRERVRFCKIKNK